MRQAAASSASAKRFRALAEQLLALADPPSSGTADQILLGTLAAAAYEARRARAHYLPPDLFAEPAWDMLLVLYSADAEGREVPTTSLCIASTAASTTALRHIALLESSGLIERRPNPRDNRVTLIRLSPKGRIGMGAYLASSNWVAGIGTPAQDR